MEKKHRINEKQIVLYPWTSSFNLHKRWNCLIIICPSINRLLRYYSYLFNKLLIHLFNEKTIHYGLLSTWVSSTVYLNRRRENNIIHLIRVPLKII